MKVLAVCLLLSACVSVPEDKTTLYDCVGEFTTSLENTSIRSDLFPAVDNKIEIQASYLKNIVVIIDDGEILYFHRGLNCKKEPCNKAQLISLSKPVPKDFVKGYVVKNDSKSRKVLKTNLNATVQCLDKQDSPIKADFEKYLKVL